MQLGQVGNELEDESGVIEALKHRSGDELCGIGYFCLGGIHIAFKHGDGLLAVFRGDLSEGVGDEPACNQQVESVDFRRLAHQRQQARSLLWLARHGSRPCRVIEVASYQVAEVSSAKSGRPD